MGDGSPPMPYDGSPAMPYEPQRIPKLRQFLYDGSPAMPYEAQRVPKQHQFLAQAHDTENFHDMAQKLVLLMAGTTLAMSLAIATRLICFRSVSARELREPLAPVTVKR